MQRDKIQNNTALMLEGSPINHWNDLSIQEKAAMMDVAIKNGITDLKDIRDKYNEFAEGGDINSDNWTMEDENQYQIWRASLPDNLRNTDDKYYDMRAAFRAGMTPTLKADGKYHLGSRDPETGRILKAPYHPTYLEAVNTDARLGYYPTVDSRGNTYTNTWEGNLYGGGGYKPSERIKKRISNWEGAAMYKDTIDPLSGKMAKRNAPFETVTSGFVSVLPASIRERVLSNQELADNLFSYAYNVGPGRFRERVVPTLIKYYSGQATANDIAQSMWASGDAKLRGLRNRRAEERAGVLSALGANPVTDVPIPETTAPAFMPSNPQAFFNPIASYTPSEVVVPMETESPLATYDPEELKRREQAQYRNNFTTMMSLLYPQDNSMDLLSMFTNNSYSKGGSIHIDPSKKGTFTAAATKHGMGVQEFASKVLANKDDYSSAMVKKANFARNFGGKKHSYGGNLFDDGGAGTL